MISSAAKRFYAVAGTIAIAVLVLGLSLIAPILSTSEDFSIYNHGWNGTSSLAVSVYKSGRLVPTLEVSATGSDIEVTHLDFSSFDLDPAKSALIVIGPSKPFSTADGKKVGDFVRGGGRLLLADDFGSGNSLLQKMSAKSRFSGKLMLDLAFDKQPEFSVCFNISKTSSLMTGVTTLLMNFPSTINVSGSTTVLATSSVASYLDRNGNHLRDLDEPKGPFPVIAIERLGAGQILLVSDPSMLINGMLKQADNRVLANNSLSYLSAGREKVFFDESHRNYFDPISITMMMIGQASDVLKGGLIAVVMLVLLTVITDYPQRALRWIVRKILWIWHSLIGLIFRKREAVEEKKRLSDEELMVAVMGRHPEWRPGLLRMLLSRQSITGRRKAGDTVKLEYHMRDRPDDLIAVVVIAILLVFIIAFAPTSPIRPVFGLIFILILPGYVATAALFPNRESIDVIERVALSLGLSIAIVPLAGLALNYTPFGIRLEPIEAVLTGFVMIVSFVAWRRRLNLPEDERFVIDVDVNLSMAGMPLVDRALTVGIVITLAATLILLAYVVAVPRSGESFTQLALLGPTMKAEGYPRNLTVNQNATVIVSVGSFETSLKNYSLVILLQPENSTGPNITHWRGGSPFSATQSLNSGLGMALNFTLQQHEYMNSTFNFSVSQNGTFKLRFMLFLDGQDLSATPYRETDLWLYVRTSS